METQGYTIKKIEPLQGLYKIPSDESLFQESLFILTQAVGKSTISSSFIPESVTSTIRCLQNLGVRIRKISNSTIEVYGLGVRGLNAPVDTLKIGKSRLALHLLLGLVASYPFRTVITGNPNFSHKFNTDCIEHFSNIGSEIIFSTLPIVVKGNEYCVPHVHVLRHSCSYVKSALLMAGLNIKGTTTVVEPFSGSTDSMAMMMKHLGADIKITKSEATTKTAISGITELHRQNITIPGDPLIALFLVTAATLIPGSEIFIDGVYLNEINLKIYKVLEKMGARINATVSGKNLGNQIGSISIKSASLKGITVKESEISMDHYFQVLLFLLCTANGKSSVESKKRLKISNKLNKFIQMMQELGARIEVTDSSINIEGTTFAGGKSVDANHDYLLGNILILSGLISNEPITIYNYNPLWFDLYCKSHEN